MQNSIIIALNKSITNSNEKKYLNKEYKAIKKANKKNITLFKKAKKIKDVATMVSLSTKIDLQTERILKARLKGQIVVNYHNFTFFQSIKKLDIVKNKAQYLTGRALRIISKKIQNESNNKKKDALKKLYNKISNSFDEGQKFGNFEEVQTDKETEYIPIFSGGANYINVKLI